MTCGVYKIEGTTISSQQTAARWQSRPVYIGQSKNIENRWKEHHKSYDPREFEYTIIMTCRPEHLQFFERAFILAYNSHDAGMNNTGPWGLDKCVLPSAADYAELVGGSAVTPPTNNARWQLTEAWDAYDPGWEDDETWFLNYLQELPQSSQ
jgi:hypothetical protein